MDSGRFETFIDAIIAIMLTVMVLKIPQPETMDLMGIWNLRIMYLSYIISYLILFSIWDHHRRLFFIVKEINNRIIWFYSVLIFLMTFIPYATAWAAHYPYDLTPEILFGFLILVINIMYVFIAHQVLKQKYLENNTEDMSFRKIFTINVSTFIIGIILSVAINPVFMMITSLVTIIVWNIISQHDKTYEIGDNSGI